MSRKDSNWLRPHGIPQGNWRYIQDSSIARDYDQSLNDSPLITIDQSLIEAGLPAEKGVVVDFGCGTGRNLLPLIENGWDGIGVDLSWAMLNEFADKVKASPLIKEARKCTLVQANLMELEGFADSIADFGQCMFSTFGMIQGKQNRAKFLRHAKRILKADAPFVIHAHNYWNSLRLPGGLRWMCRNFVAALCGRCERGDRFADYRVAKGLMLHHFSQSTFENEMRSGGFVVEKTWGILENGKQLEAPSPRNFKVVGWVLNCRNQK